MLSHFSQILYVAASRAPFLLAILFGTWLCTQHVGRRPRAVKLTAIAIALLVASLLTEFLLPLLGGSHPISAAGWFGIMILQSLLQAAALGVLFWAVFADEYEAGSDEPPVFRYDDGTVADD